MKFNCIVLLLIFLFISIPAQAAQQDVYTPIITSDPSLSATVFATDGTATMDVNFIDGRLHVSDYVHGVKDLRVLNSVINRLKSYNGNEVMLYHVNDAGVKDSSRLVPVQSDGTWTYFYDVVFSEVIIDGFVGTWEVTAYNLSVSDSLNFGQTFNGSDISSIGVDVTDDVTKSDPYDINTTGLVGWWKLDDDYLDSSGNGNNGTAYGDTHFVNVKYNNGSSADGTGDYIEILHSDSTNISTNELSISLNTQFDDSNDYRRIFTKGIIEPAAYGLRTEELASHSVEFKISINNIIYYLRSDGFQNEEDNNIVIIYDNSSVKMYINNVLQSNTITVSGNVDTNNNNILIAKRVGVAAFLNGTVDNILLYNKALSESERNNLYYDHLQQLQTKTNSNSTWSDEWNSTADNPIQVPYKDGELFSLLNFTVPETVVQNGITIYDYQSTVQFDAIATVGYTEDITKITESATAGTYKLNITHAAGNTGEGYINYTTANSVLLDADFWNSAVLTTDNPNATLSSTLPHFDINTGYVPATIEYYYLITQDYFYPPQNLVSIPDVEHIHFDWDNQSNVDYWNISQLIASIPYTPLNVILDGISDACYDSCGYGVVGDSPNPSTDYGQELIYILRNDTYLILYADGEDNDGLPNDDNFLIGIDASNNNLSTDDRKFLLNEGGTVTAKRWSGSAWLPIATNAQGVVVNGGIPGAIQYEMFIPISELDTNFTNGSTIKFFMSRTHTSSNPNVESYYPQRLINTTDATLWKSVNLTPEQEYEFITNVTLSNYTVLGLDVFTWYKHKFTTINGSQESTPVYSTDITGDLPSYSISGYIEDSDGNPINNVSVWLQNGFVQSFGYSNISGYFSGFHVHAGNYTIYANKTCYVENSIDVYVTTNLTNQNITLANVIVTNCELLNKLDDIEDSIISLSEDDFKPTEGNYEMLSSTYNMFLLLLGACFILAFPKRGEVTSRDTGLNNVLFSFLGTILSVFLAQIIVSGQVIESFAFESQIYDPLQHYFLYLIAVIMFVVFVLNVVYYVRQRID